MDTLQVIGAVVTFVAVAVGATWALRTKLSDIEIAVRGHVAEDKVVQKNHETRIIKLEGRRRR